MLVEAGSASGREPTVTVELRSYLGQFLQESGVTLGAEDEGSFPMRLLHFRRTFVEKLFAIHSKVELLRRDGQPLGTYARHYYDLFQLAIQHEVTAMLNSPEYAAIKTDYDQISRTHFSRSYFHPEGMSFARSDALFPPDKLSTAIGAEYDAQCRMLCLRPLCVMGRDSSPASGAEESAVSLPVPERTGTGRGSRFPGTVSQ